MAGDDPRFEEKAADIIALYLIAPYMDPPRHAAVFCLDEKMAIQALDRLDPVLPLSPGSAEKHGSFPLCAALDGKTGQVHGKTARRHTSEEFFAFVKDVVDQTPKSKDIHIILDNLSAHKTKTVAVSMRNPQSHSAGHIPTPADGSVYVIAGTAH